MNGKKWIWLLAAALAIGGCSSDEPAAVNVSERIEVPDFTLNDTEGNAVTLSSFRGKSPVLLVFWATWCGICREEMPRIVKLQSEYGDRLKVLGIDIEEPAEQVAALAKKMNLNYPQLLDLDGAVAAEYGVVGVPTLVLIDLEGKGVIAQHALSKKVLSVIEKITSEGASQPS